MDVRSKNQVASDGLVGQMQKTLDAREAKDTKEVRTNRAGESRTNRASDDEESYKVSLSPESQKVKEFREKLLKAAKDSPDVREEKVARLKEQIREGKYVADSGKIADGMLREAIRDELATTTE